MVPETREIRLVGGGTQYDIPATKRPCKKKVKSTEVVFYTNGGPVWSLVVKAPPQLEFLALIKY